jgi:predicted CXXCH cytochrome family protein
MNSPKWRRKAELTTSVKLLYIGVLMAMFALAHGQTVMPAPGLTAGYVGSAACKTCHPAMYARWSKTRMANVVTDPKTHPEVIIPDLAKADPLLKFKLDDIALVYGTKWKQRYFQKVGNDYFPLGAQWDVNHKVWRAYNVAKGTDWWTQFYPAENSARPTGPLCDGCHSVNYNIRNNTVTEWNVGCEKCHGPGSAHTTRPARSNIVNPARLDFVRANDVCIQCHSQGQPVKSPMEGKYYDWPVGFHVGLDLKTFWKLEENKLGETTFTHFPDGTGHKNRMQGNDFVSSVMYTRGITCFSCHDVHGSENNADLLKPASVMCLQCHGPASPNGPHTASIEQHTHHKAGSTGNECIGCHMPKIEQTIADINVRSHTFRFVPPSATEIFKIPNSCNSCHTDKTVDWAKDTLRGWPNFSPWRVAQ